MSIQHDLGITVLNKGEIDFCINLRDNYFLFEDQFYLQKRGTAMGLNVAPSYANAYMAHFKKIHIYPNHLYLKHAIVWQRYIDNIYCIWDGDILFNYLNSIGIELQFTIHHDLPQINFLDTMVIKSELNTLTTDLYTKHTERLVHLKSCHCKNVKKKLYPHLNTLEQTCKIRINVKKIPITGLPVSDT